jgi:hypothetical protein
VLSLHPLPFPSRRDTIVVYLDLAKGLDVMTTLIRSSSLSFAYIYVATKVLRLHVERSHRSVSATCFSSVHRCKHFSQLCDL